jgi:hypothetical protein
MNCPICNDLLNIDFNNPAVICNGSFIICESKRPHHYSIDCFYGIPRHQAYIGPFKLTWNTLTNNLYIYKTVAIKEVNNASYNDFIKYCNKSKLWTTFS